MKEIYDDVMSRPHGYYLGPDNEVLGARFDNQEELGCFVRDSFKPVAVTRVGRFIVSTTFLSSAFELFGHEYFFETALIDRGDGRNRLSIWDRYETWAQAESNHNAVISVLKFRDVRRKKRLTKHRRKWK